MIINTEKGELFWGGHIYEGTEMPFKAGFSGDLHQTGNNQTSYLLLSNKGRVIYSDAPFRFEVHENYLTITNDTPLIHEVAGKNLKDAYLYAMNTFYAQKTAKIEESLFSAPQFNTWIELGYNQNQEDILQYAEKIHREGFKSGVLMIDDNWQEDYGVWKFHEGRFPDPVAMVRKLHALGFKVMLWVCPFVSPDSFTFRELDKKGLLVKKSKNEIHIVKWWNGYSAVLDLSHPGTSVWFKEQLDNLQQNFGIDGFKFDAGAPQDYPKDGIYYDNTCYGYRQSQKFTEFASFYPLSELRETCNCPQFAAAQRLCDKNHSWDHNGLNTLIPDSIAQSLMGYQFICPDMIGGGIYTDMTEEAGTLDQELIVRYAQASALLPMMQFSAAPWRILNKENYQYCLSAAKLHEKFSDYIIEAEKESIKTREPIVKHLEYAFPNQGFEHEKQQYLLGDRILVAPVTKKGLKEMEILLPKGKWIADDGTEYEGGEKITIETPLARLPYFVKA